MTEMTVTPEALLTRFNCSLDAAVRYSLADASARRSELLGIRAR